MGRAFGECGSQQRARGGAHEIGGFVTRKAADVGEPDERFDAERRTDGEQGATADAGTHSASRETALPLLARERERVEDESGRVDDDDVRFDAGGGSGLGCVVRRGQSR